MSQEHVRTCLKWGTYGKNPTSFNDEDIQWVLIKDLADEHIGAILDTQWQVPGWYKNILVNELLFRLKNSISIPEVERYYVQ